MREEERTKETEQDWLERLERHWLEGSRIPT